MNRNDEETRGRKLFVGGLDHVTDDVSLGKFFSQWGEVVDSVVMRDDNGQSRGFGFVTFASSQMAQYACDAKPHHLDGRNVDTKMATPKEEMNIQSNPRKVFIGGLNRETNASQLQEFFGRYGAISDSVVILSPETRESRGFGFVTFESADAAEQAVANKPHVIGNAELVVKIAVSREKKGPRRGGGPSRGGRRPYGAANSNGGYNNYGGGYGSGGYGGYGGGYEQSYGATNGGSWGQQASYNGVGGGFGDGFGSYPQQNSRGGPMRNYQSNRGSGPYTRY